LRLAGLVLAVTLGAGVLAGCAGSQTPAAGEATAPATGSQTVSVSEVVGSPTVSVGDVADLETAEEVVREEPTATPARARSTEVAAEESEEKVTPTISSDDLETKTEVPVSAPPGVDVESVVFGYDDPVQVTNAGDGTGRLFVVEKPGRVWIVQFGVELPEPFLDIRDVVGDFGQEQGLLSMAFHPDFESNGVFYVDYTDLNGNTVIARYRAEENQADGESGLVLLYIQQPFRNHNGGQIAFGPDGYLYVGTGDGGSANDPKGNGQNLDTLLGKMLRFDVSDPDVLAIPPENPFVGDTAARDEIWAYGLRNPWRFTFDRETGDLYIADVGQNRLEEVHFVSRAQLDGPALNFGWNTLEGSECFGRGECDRTGLEEPVAEYGHDQGCSITGGFVYRGQERPGLNGVYLYADWCSGIIWGLIPNGAGGWLSGIVGKAEIGISSFGEDEAAEMYVTGMFTGALYEVVVAKAG
jgi:glucose/arabinose dehydrogenase